MEGQASPYAPRTLGLIAGALFDDMPPVTMGRFEIVRRLGRGGMGVVYLAVDPDLKREVAIKVHRGRADPGSARRLQREAESLATLRHPSVVGVHEVGRTDDGEVFVVMEYVAGPTLRAWIAREAPSAARMVEMFARCAEGLHAAHTAGLVHRDFKPDNVLVDPAGAPKIIDFGLARAHGPVELPSDAELRLDDSITRSDEVLGTPRYMAPELWACEQPSAASDQFALCVALYEALVGAPPFAGRPEGTPPRLGELPGSLQRVLRRGLAIDPSQRWTSLAELARRLEAARRRPARVRIAAAGVVVLGAIGWAAVAAAGPGRTGPQLLSHGDPVPVVACPRDVNLLGDGWGWVYDAPFVQRDGTLALELPTAPWSYRTAQIYDPLMTFQNVAIELEIAEFPDRDPRHEFSISLDNEQYEGMADILVFGSHRGFAVLPNAEVAIVPMDLDRIRHLRISVRDVAYRGDRVTMDYSTDGTTWTTLAEGMSHVGAGRIVLHVGSQHPVTADDRAVLTGLYCRDLPAER